MLFNSSEFLVFLACFGALYALATGLQPWVSWRNGLLILASYIFYAQWDPRFTLLLFFTTALDFSVSWHIGSSPSQRRKRALLIVSVVLNLGVLAAFKYFDFFRESLEILLDSFGQGYRWKPLMIFVPVGLSFYTFQSMSYVVDVYRGQLAPCRNFVQFMAYESFFPQLVAGPICRGKTLLHQFASRRAATLRDLESGVWLMLWGMFKKVVLADNLAPLVELVYEHADPSAPMLALGTLAFGLQIYCDFSGYTDIARGLARALGFDLGLNFNLPYLATSLIDFWRRWHISLSSWLRDYLYIPLGGNRNGQASTCLNLGLTMLLGGLWHGASVTFILWGLWHGLGLVANHLWAGNRPQGRALPAWAGWILTQVFVLFGWMLFRANSLDKLVGFAAHWNVFTLPMWWQTYLKNLLVLGAPLAAMQFWQWRSGDLEATLTLSRWPKAALQATLLLFIIAYWPRDHSTPFIYFQF